MYSVDSIPYEVARMLQSEVVKLPPVAAFIRKAEGTAAIVELREFVDATVNQRRSNEGRYWLSTSVFSLLEMECERHTKNKTEAAKLSRLQRKAAKALGVPAGESSLPWMLAEATE